MRFILLIIESIRLKQWVKNLFIFIPLIFGGKLFDTTSLFNAAITFFIFCLASGGIYLLNDIRDKDRDSFHPLKRKRPIASGMLDVKIALIASLIFIFTSLWISIFLENRLFLITLMYIALHVFYTFRFKTEVVLDVMIIAVGFEMRIWAGAVAVHVQPSVWIQLCVFVLALFLGFIKRRYEKMSLYKDAVRHRRILSLYKVYFLDQMIMISATLCIICYGLYTVSEDLVNRLGDNYMAYTIPFIIYGIFRYLYIAHVKKLGGDPEEILISDFPLILDILLWVSLASFLIYNPFK